MSLREEENLDMDSNWGKMAMWGWRQRLEWCGQKPRNVKDCWLSPEAERGQKVFFPRVFGGSTSLPKPWSQTSGLQNCERLHFCCFKPLSLWHCIKAVIGKQYQTYLKKKMLHLPKCCSSWDVRQKMLINRGHTLKPGDCVVPLVMLYTGLYMHREINLERTQDLSLSDKFWEIFIFLF